MQKFRGFFKPRNFLPAKISDIKVVSVQRICFAKSKSMEKISDFILTNNIIQFSKIYILFWYVTVLARRKLAETERIHLQR